MPLQHIASGESQREFVFSQHGSAGQAQYLIASKDWTYFYSSADDREYCYNLAVDPLQQHLVGTASPFQRAAVDRLRTQLQAFIAEQGGEIAEQALENGGWKRYPGKSLSDNPNDMLLVQDCRWSRAQSFIPGYSDAEKYRGLYGDGIGDELVAARPELAPYFA